jgi:Outer membrane protein beta-barrel domain
MRRWTLGTAVLSILTLGAAPLAAQSVSVGPMAGASFFTFHGDDSEVFSADLGTTADKGTRTGFAAGAFLEYEFGNTWAIEPQVLYVEKGGKYSASASGLDATAKVKLGYIQVPVLFKAEFRKADRGVTPSIFLGPAIGFKVSCSLSVDISGFGSESGDCGDSGVKGTEFSGVFGAGLEFNRFSLQGRYDLGLSSIAENDLDVKNGGFLVTLGYAFRLK